MMGISKHNIECQRHSVDWSIALDSRPYALQTSPEERMPFAHTYMTDHPGLPRGPNVITKVLLSETTEGGESQRAWRCCAASLGRWRKWPRNSRNAGKPPRWRRQSFPLELPEGMRPCRHHDFSPARSMSDFWLSELWSLW